MGSRTGLVFALLGLAGCRAFGADESAADATSTEHATTKATPAADATTPDAAAPDAPDVIANGSSWLGTLAKTGPVTYGNRLCTYEMTYSDVRLAVTLDANGVVTAATVNATADEEASTLCLDVPNGVNPHLYTLKTPTDLPDGNGKHLELAPDASNATQASLVIEGAFADGAAPLKLRWVRTDTTNASLIWNLEAAVTPTRSE